MLAGRCLSYGEGLTFWPVVEAVRSALVQEDRSGSKEALPHLESLLAPDKDAGAIAERLGALLGLSRSSFPVEETFWAFRKLLERMSGRRPVVIVFDDVHCGSPVFLDLIEHLTQQPAAEPC